MATAVFQVRSPVVRGGRSCCLSVCVWASGWAMFHSRLCMMDLLHLVWRESKLEVLLDVCFFMWAIWLCSCICIYTIDAQRVCVCIVTQYCAPFHVSTVAAIDARDVCQWDCNRYWNVWLSYIASVQTLRVFLYVMLVSVCGLFGSECFFFVVGGPWAWMRVVAYVCSMSFFLHVPFRTTILQESHFLTSEHVLENKMPAKTLW